MYRKCDVLSMISTPRGHNTPDISLTTGEKQLHSLTSSRQLSHHNFSPLLADVWIHGLRSWFKAAVKLVRGSVTDETTKGRGSFHTLMFTFPVSLFPQKLGVHWLFGSEGLQLEGGLHSHLNTSHLGGDEGERRHQTAVATCLCFSHQHIPILQHSQITSQYTSKSNSKRTANFPLHGLFSSTSEMRVLSDNTLSWRFSHLCKMLKSCMIYGGPERSNSL